jgi:hypothetical protein
MEFYRTTVLSFLLLCMMVLLAACGKDSPTYGILPSGQTFKQSKAVFNNQLDILWVVDNSGSMSPLQNNMVNNFTSFIKDFQSKGYDFHMAVTTTEAYKSEAQFSNNSTLAKFLDGTDSTSHTGIFDILPTTPNLNNVFVTNASQGSNGSGDERAFSSMRDALNSKLNTGFLRSQSFFAVIILSDEDDFSSAQRVEASWILANNDPNFVPDHDYNYSKLDTVSSYENYLDILTASSGTTRRYNVSSITVLDNNCLAQHQADSSTSIIGQRYIQISTDTNGVLGSVCDQTYAKSLDAIQAQIATLSSQFFLNQVPQQNTITVTVNNSSVAQSATNGWQYNASANSILFYGAAVPPQGASININFVPMTIKN